MSQPLWKFPLSIQNIALHGGTAFSHAWSLAVEDQFYLALPFLLLFLFRGPRLAIIIPCLIVFGGIALRAFLAAQNPSVDGSGVSFRGFQAWIYYPTWTRLDPLVFGVALAAIEKFRPTWWQRIINCAPWLWLPALGIIVYSTLSRRNRYAHRFCVRLAIPTDRGRHGRASCLRGQSATAALSSCDSRRRIHRQHCLQCLPDSETCY